MNMKNAVKGIIGLFLITVIGCSPYRIVQNKTDRSATWSDYRTFAFIDTNRVGSEPGTSYMAAMERIKKEVTVQMRQRGYQLTNDNPDLLVNLGAVVREKTQTRQTTIQEAPLYVGQRRYHWQSQEVPVGNYQEGTLNVHIVDAHRNALVWDAAISRVITSQPLANDELQQAVGRLFEKLPKS